MKNSMKVIEELAKQYADELNEEYISTKVNKNKITIKFKGKTIKFSSETEFLEEYESCFDLSMWGPPGFTDSEIINYNTK